MSFLDVMSCRLGAASNVTRRGGHDLSATGAQMRQRSLVQCGCHFETFMLLIFADRRSVTGPIFPSGVPGLVTFLG
jgi:hypothetical protein